MSNILYRLSITSLIAFLDCAGSIVNCPFSYTIGLRRFTWCLLVCIHSSLSLSRSRVSQESDRNSWTNIGRTWRTDQGNNNTHFSSHFYPWPFFSTELSRERDRLRVRAKGSIWRAKNVLPSRKRCLKSRFQCSLHKKIHIRLKEMSTRAHIFVCNRKFAENNPGIDDR